MLEIRLASSKVGGLGRAETDLLQHRGKVDRRESHLEDVRKKAGRHSDAYPIGASFSLTSSQM